jgi:hypothetical protein
MEGSPKGMAADLKSDPALYTILLFPNLIPSQKQGLHQVFVELSLSRFSSF